MFEDKLTPVLSRAEFTKRVSLHLFASILILVVGLGIGMVGYHVLAGLDWIESFLNASMILGGMGPVDTLTTNPAKIFAGCYALFSGLAFIAIASLLIVPFAHRVLHRFHLGGDED